MKCLLLFLFFFSFKIFANLAVSEPSLEKSLAESIHFSEKGPNFIGHLYVGGHETQISQGTFVYVKNALDYYRELKPIFIILELDTPGGQVFPAQKISDLLKQIDIQSGIPVVAFINNWAISAGAMLAYSCRYIATVKDGSMGAASPVTQTGEATSEKVNSAIRTDFANRASFFDRNPLIAEAMVDADMILVLRDGQIQKLNSVEQIKAGDDVITTKGKLLTLNSSEMVNLGVADFRLMPQKLTPITGAEKKEGKWPAHKELIFSYPFFSKIPNATVVSFKMDWKTRFFSFLASPIVTSILFLGLVVCFYMEFSTPGFGIFGILGIVFLVLLILASFAVEAASYLEFIILGAGVLLILLELFVIPGFGIAGILGILLALGGLIALLLPGIRSIHYDFDSKTFNAAGHYVFERLVWFAGALVVGFLVIAFLAKFFTPKFGRFSPLVLKTDQVGYSAGMDKELLPEVGTLGVVLSPLRTAGKIMVNDEVYDAVSSGSFIDKGVQVKVVKIEGSKIIVEEVHS